MIKKVRITLLLLSISVVVFGQELPKEKTENHKRINGTNILMVPPVTFEKSENFKGFQNPTDQTSMIMAMVIPGPFLESTKGFNSKLMKSKGIKLKVKKDIKVGWYDGFFVELEQPANSVIYSKYILVFGDEKSTTLINGVFLKDSSELGERIRQSILSTYIDSNLNVNPRESLNFTINENVGSLKFKAVVGNGILFNRDLKTPTESIDKATLIVEKSFAKMEIENKKFFCISRLKKYPDDFSIILDKGINEIEIDDLKGYELFARNNDKLEEEMYQVILFDENGTYFIFFGTYLKGSESAITDIQNVIKSFKRTE